PITTFQQLHEFLTNYTNVSITLLLPNHTFHNISVYIPNHLLGVYVTYYIPGPLISILTFFTWMFIVNFSRSLFNAAPLIITDGGKLLTEALKRFLGENGEKVSFYLQSIFLLTFIFAIFVSNRPPG
ncbi:S2P metalloprotease, partial [Sulfolobus sp. A20-N-G8]